MNQVSQKVFSGLPILDNAHGNAQEIKKLSYTLKPDELSLRFQGQASSPVSKSSIKKSPLWMALAATLLSMPALVQAESSPRESIVTYEYGKPVEIIFDKLPSTSANKAPAEITGKERLSGAFACTKDTVNYQEYSFDKIMNAIEEGCVKSAFSNSFKGMGFVLSAEQVEMGQRTVYVDPPSPKHKTKLIEALDMQGIPVVDAPVDRAIWESSMFQTMMIMSVFIGLAVYSAKRQAGAIDLNKSGSSVSLEKKPDVTFDDVGGMPDKLIKRLRKHVAYMNEMAQKAENRPRRFKMGEWVATRTPRLLGGNLLRGSVVKRLKTYNAKKAKKSAPVTLNVVPERSDRKFNLLLKGPPGVGKTYLAKAIAGEANVPFFNVSASQFVEMYVGVGAKRVRDLFAVARRNQPCVVFIDEIDAVGKPRDTSGRKGSSEREQTLNQLLIELQGLEDDNQIMVIAATNYDKLDGALTREGRFEEVQIPGPRSEKQRIDILTKSAERLARKTQESNPQLTEDFNLFDPDMDWKEVAKLLKGASGADINGVVERAMDFAGQRKTAPFVNIEDLYEGYQLLALGDAEPELTEGSLNDRFMVAGHESGHAMSVLFVNQLMKNLNIRGEDGKLQGLFQLKALSMVPRVSGSLGHVLFVQDVEFSKTLLQSVTNVIVALGGRAQEEVVAKKSIGNLADQGVSTAGANDWEQATNELVSTLKRGMVRGYNVSSSKADAGGNPELSYEESIYVNGMMERIYKAVLEAMTKLDEEFPDKAKTDKTPEKAGIWTTFARDALKVDTIWEDKAKAFFTDRLNIVAVEKGDKEFNWKPYESILKKLLADITKAHEVASDKAIKNWASASSHEHPKVNLEKVEELEASAN